MKLKKLSGLHVNDSKKWLSHRKTLRSAPNIDWDLNICWLQSDLVFSRIYAKTHPTVIWEHRIDTTIFCRLSALMFNWFCVTKTSLLCSYKTVLSVTPIKLCSRNSKNWFSNLKKKLFLKRVKQKIEYKNKFPKKLWNRQKVVLFSINIMFY